MTELLFGVLLQGLKLWNTKEANKYLDEVIRLRQEWMDEINKPRGKRSNADIDAIELRLSLIARTFVDFNGKSQV